eukprot:4188414-Amphidinium_carterae.1
MADINDSCVVMEFRSYCYAQYLQFRATVFMVCLATYAQESTPEQIQKGSSVVLQGLSTMLHRKKRSFPEISERIQLMDQVVPAHVALSAEDRLVNHSQHTLSWCMPPIESKDLTQEVYPAYQTHIAKQQSTS